MVSSNILQRVFAIRVGSDQGTGFTIDVDNRQYLITAKHVIASSPNNIEILHDNKWVNLPIKLIAVEPASVDIAVIVLPQQISALLPIQLSGPFYLSQNVFFIGFPYGLSLDGHALNAGFPLPFVKHGIIASFANGHGEPIFIDGINNPGFSGGPVITSEGPDKQNVLGVVSAYRFDLQSVYIDNKVKAENLAVRTNTGLLIAFEIRYALEAIKKNPIGFPILVAPSTK